MRQRRRLLVLLRLRSAAVCPPCPQHRQDGGNGGNDSRSQLDRWVRAELDRAAVHQLATLPVLPGRIQQRLGSKGQEVLDELCMCAQRSGP